MPDFGTHSGELPVPTGDGRQRNAPHLRRTGQRAVAMNVFEWVAIAVHGCGAKTTQGSRLLARSVRTCPPPSPSASPVARPSPRRRQASDHRNACRSARSSRHHEATLLFTGQLGRLTAGHLDERPHLLIDGGGAVAFPLQCLVPRRDVAGLGVTRVVALDAFDPGFTKDAAMLVRPRGFSSSGRWQA